MKQYAGLYVLKALCALFVVMIHFPIFAKVGWDPLIKTSVPVFYMISGFFLLRDMNDEDSTNNRLKKALGKSLKLLLLSSGIYIFYNYIFFVGG